MTFRPYAAFTAAALAITAATSVAAQDFRALASQDLVTAQQEIRENHPALVVGGPEAAAFRSYLDTGLAEAQALIGQVNSGDSHAYLMRYFAAGFRDSNLRITPTFDLLGPYFGISWGGVTTGWRDGQYVVTHVADGVRRGPRVGSVVTECNGVPIEQFAMEKLDRWEGDLTTEAGRVRSAPYLLWNRNNPFTRGLPQTCKFQEGRRSRDYELQIQPVSPQALEAAYRATVYMPGDVPLAVEQVNGRPWVHAHSLSEDADWAAFNASILAQADALRGPQGFVLDLRGANGSEFTSTRRAYGLVNRIWTPEFTVSRQPVAGNVIYRVSQDNRDWFADTLARMEADPLFVEENPAIIEETRAVVEAFDAAMAAGQESFVLPGREPVADTGAPNPVQGPVIVLVDAGCAGGCLDVLDLLVNLPNVRLAGSTTAEDSIFIEPTVMRLPSNYADLTYGHKAWTDRERGNNEPHQPAEGLRYTGNPADEVAVRTWVSSLFGG